MKAIVMAGGLGTRLKPLTNNCPKPLLTFLNKPILLYTLNLLKRHNFNEVVLTLGYQAKRIQDFFGDGTQLGLKIHYVVETSPLGTAGGVKNAQEYLDDAPFLVFSGDVITDIDLGKMLSFHHQKQAKVTIAVKHVFNPEQYGVLVTDKKGAIQNYVEKPSQINAPSNLVNTGIYIMHPSVLDMMMMGQVYDFSYHIFPQLIKQNQAFFAYCINAYWCDIGTTKTYVQALADTLAGRVQYT